MENQKEIKIRSKSGDEYVLAAVVKSSRHFGELVLPFACKKSDNHLLKVEYLLSTIELDDDWEEVELIKTLHSISASLDPVLLVRKFSKLKMVPKDFQSAEHHKLLDKFILPYVWKQVSELIRLLAYYQIPVFDTRFWPYLYEENRIEIEKEEAQTRLYFDRGESSTNYVLEAWSDNEKINLMHPNNRILTVVPCHLLTSKSIVRFDESVNGNLLRPFLAKQEIIIPARVEKEYFEKFIKKIASTSNIEAKGFSLVDIETQAIARLSVETSWDGKVGFVLSFEYGDKRMYCDHPQQVITNLKITEDGFEFLRIKRDLLWEQQQYAELEALGLKKASSFFVRTQPDSELHSFLYFVREISSVLAEQGFKVDQNSEIRYNLDMPSVTVKLTTEYDWFDLQLILQIGDYQLPFISLRNHILEKEKVFVLEDGTRFLIPEAWFERYSGIFIHGKKQQQHLRLQKQHYPLLELLDLPDFDKNISNTHSDSQLILPVLNNAQLRPYQEYGFYWLRNHALNNSGAILADDMGLGKTIQVIALLTAYFKNSDQNTEKSTIIDQSTKWLQEGQLDLFSTNIQIENKKNELSKKKDPALIVMPTSLIHNWKDELGRFSPQLRVYEYTGGSRTISKKIMQSHEVVLTTYGIMRKDSDKLQQLNFSFIILDESQQIKNASSKTATAAYSLQGDLKFALTGTPIENHLSDLWSQMQFVNPDLLGSLNDFNKYYSIPIARNPEAPQHEKLMTLISAYILRRTKQQVAPELPPLTETVIFCDMTEDQREHYEEEKSRMRNALLDNVIETQAKQESSVYYLTALMKLRQLANHPRLLFPEENLSSGKFDVLLEWLETILDENHKVLIFSSFVTQLEILEEFLVEKEIPFSKLTGATGKRDEVIKMFRNDVTKRVFLISLKAGGVGLNLAEADYVFILDPWWNPAAESQAISRAHRIGQQKSVFVYRFITRETIEEKIMRMQEKKRLLAENTILEESFYSALSREELLELMQ